ncbi:MAG: PqqD family protein [Bryobacteraceae bacterium]|nr:PqqD family protein [Bryobacteraceae bacterium]
MIAPDARLKPHKDVIHTKLANGEVVLLHLGSESYFSLNETGSAIWTLLDGNATLEQIAGEIESRYEVSPEQALASVAELAEQLVAQKLATLEHPLS